MTRRPIPPIIATGMPRCGFSGVTVLVVGDLMLDRYVFGDVRRISPEAPVPVLTMTGEKAAAGGAANVALNVAGLRARAHVFGVVGQDAAASRLIEVLSARGVDTTGVVVDTARPSTCKTRVMCGTHQIVRLDQESTHEIPDHPRQQLLDRFWAAVRHHAVNAVILSDYAKGVLSAGLTRSVIEGCAAREIPVFVDPKKSSYSLYRQATCITPNLSEFHGALPALGIPEGDVAWSAGRLREALQCPLLLITQGADGMTLISRNGGLHLPALVQEVFDVSGAGDTVIATMAAAIGYGLEPAHAAGLANIAASLVVQKLGTAPVEWQELEALLPQGTVQDEMGSSIGAFAADLPTATSDQKPV